MISCRCPTYGRVSFLEEAIYSFINQEDLQDSELVIVNDYPLQTLIFEHPNVRIYNLKETFNTIGEKENFTIGECKGDIITFFDDDDIALPWHLKNIRKYFIPGTNALHWARGIYYNEPNITSITYVGNSGMVFTKDAWERAGRSPLMNAGGDSIFRDNVHKLGSIVDAYPPDEEVSWFYRWGSVHDPENGRIGVLHQSGEGFDKPNKPNIIQRHSLYIEKMRIQGYIPTGEIILHPRWNRPYDLMLKKFIEK